MASPRAIQRTYLGLLFGNTLAASLIWGINTIFLLDAGLTNLEAFAANAFFTAGMVVFEVPTGIVADTVGRRASYLLGTVTLSASTLLYVLLWEIGAAFWLWAIVSMLLGLGFTFFSGAVEAWWPRSSPARRSSAASRRRTPPRDTRDVARLTTDLTGHADVTGVGALRASQASCAARTRIQSASRSAASRSSSGRPNTSWSPANHSDRLSRVRGFDC